MDESCAKTTNIIKRGVRALTGHRCLGADTARSDRRSWRAPPVPGRRSSRARLPTPAQPQWQQKPCQPACLRPDVAAAFIRHLNQRLFREQKVIWGVRCNHFAHDFQPVHMSHLHRPCHPGDIITDRELFMLCEGQQLPLPFCGSFEPCWTWPLPSLAGSAWPSSQTASLAPCTERLVDSPDSTLLISVGGERPARTQRPSSQSAAAQSVQCPHPVSSSVS